MKKITILCLASFLTPSFKIMIIIALLIGFCQEKCLSSDQWDKTDPAGTESPSDLDTLITTNNNVVDRVLADYRQGLDVAYASASSVTVAAGQIVCDNAARSLRRWRENTSATTVTFSDIDTGAEAASTTYYVYAVADTDVATFTLTVSTSASAPTGKTYYARIGYFDNDSDSDIDSDSVVDDSGISLTDGSVSTAKLASSAVTNAKITDATIDLTAKVTGTLPVGNGGTGATAAANAANGVAICDASGYITSELETYDSDWFAVGAATAYDKTHGLGTRNMLCTIWFSASSAGTNAVKVDIFVHGTSDYGMQVKALSTTTYRLQTQIDGVAMIISDTGEESSQSSGYARVVMLALD